MRWRNTKINLRILWEETLNKRNCLIAGIGTMNSVEKEIRNSIAKAIKWLLTFDRCRRSSLRLKRIYWPICSPIVMLSRCFISFKARCQLFNPIKMNCSITCRTKSNLVRLLRARCRFSTISSWHSLISCRNWRLKFPRYSQ